MRFRPSTKRNEQQRGFQKRLEELRKTPIEKVTLDNIALGVIKQAINDYAGIPIKVDEIPPTVITEDAREYIFGRSNGNALSFEQLCFTLNISPQVARREIRENPKEIKRRLLQTRRS